MPKRKNKAVFLDRDGTIIKQVDFLTKSRQIVVLPGAAEAIKKFNRLGYLAIIISNQPVVARGLISYGEVKKLNNLLIKKLLRLGARIDASYFCPHHPNATLRKYRMRCGCRKPAAGMIRRGIRDYGIDSKKSFMIGDSVIDVVAGRRAGVKTVLVKSGPGHERLDKFYKAKPAFEIKNLRQAVNVVKAKSGRSI